MVDKSRLAISKGQLGPVCDSCGTLMTFGESCTIDEKYVCIECYETLTGATSSTDSQPNPGLRMS
jgi:formylmethanofuran dehydrogenase subunit E